MVTAGDFKNGLTIQFENNIYQIIEFQHVKPGKGAAFVRCKLKNIKNGGVVEKTFRRLHRDFLQPHRKVRGSLRGAQGHGLQL